MLSLLRSLHPHRTEIAIQGSGVIVGMITRACKYSQQALRKRYTSGRGQGTSSSLTLEALCATILTPITRDQHGQGEPRRTSESLGEPRRASESLRLPQSAE